MPVSSEPSARWVVPGKLVLLGEYAVVDGAPAISLAIDHGVACQVWLGGQGVRIETPDGDTRFVTPALSGATPGRYRFTDQRPLDLGGQKPGFGGSAAACVAACLAAGLPATRAFSIHHQVQRGGSGVDVATSIAGGMIRYQDRGARPLPPVSPVVIWSGRSARTGPRVARYRSWPGRAGFVRDSTALVDAFSEDPLGAMREAGALLVSMAGQAGLDYLTPSLEHIMALARRVGGAAKPSGAGGGDCAVALFPDPQARARFEADCAAARLPLVPTTVSPGPTRFPPAPR